MSTSDALLDRLGVLVDRLRRQGVGVTTGAVIDAAAALCQLPLDDLAVVRAGLRSSLVKEADDAGRFDRAFAIAFAAEAPTADAERGPQDAATHAHEHAHDVSGSITEGIADALRRGDRAALEELAVRAVESFAGIDDLDGSERYHLHRVMRALDLSRMLGAAMRQLRAGDELTELELLLARSELSRLLDEFRRQLAAEIARRRSLRSGDEPPPVDVIDPRDHDIMSLSPQEVAELRRLVQPLARQLAARIGRRRVPRSTGRVDPRRTIRNSLQSGGVPVDVVHRRRHPHRPDVVLLCDVSGSVAQFAQFTFMLVNAIHDELRSVRSFAFVDGVAEVTDLFASAVYALDVNRVVGRGGVVGQDGHSDYGRAFDEFVRRHLDAISARTTVIVCGDARSNHHRSGCESLALIAEKARRVYWLNPEPEQLWDDTDSVISEFRPSCRAIFEVRTLRQLGDVVAGLV